LFNIIHVSWCRLVLIPPLEQQVEEQDRAHCAQNIWSLHSIDSVFSLHIISTPFVYII
jgi:hypothetical protein